MATDTPSTAQFVMDSPQTDTAAVPKVSIGMPVYNGEPFIREALDSLLTQTFTGFELIISDNASTDETEAICIEYAAKDERIRYIRQPENRGGEANFQFVLDEAVGEYFMWAAADDLRKIKFIECTASALDANKLVVCAMTDVAIVDESGRLLRNENLTKNRLQKCLQDPTKACVNFFKNPPSNLFFCIYGLYRKSAISSIELNYKSLVKYSSSSEIPLLAQLACIGLIVSVPHTLLAYRVHDSSAFSTEDRQRSFFSRLDGVVNICWLLLLIATEAPVSESVKAKMMVTSISTSLWRICIICFYLFLRLTKLYSPVHRLFRYLRKSQAIKNTALSNIIGIAIE